LGYSDRYSVAAAVSASAPMLRPTIGFALCTVSTAAFMPVPERAVLGKSEFVALAKERGDDAGGITAEGEINVLQFPTFTDFWCAWELQDRPRKMALLIDDMQYEYEPYVKGLVPQVKQLVAAFRAAGLPIYWSVWWRWGPDDGFFNSMDRFYGAVGANTPLNALYNHNVTHGGTILPEIGPLTPLERQRSMRKSYSLDMFDERPMQWQVDAGQGTLDDELKKLGVDTVVQVGAWTDDCIIATAFHAFALQYDVIVVTDGVSTASKNHFKALDVMGGAVAKMLDTAAIVAHLAGGGAAAKKPEAAKAPAARLIAPMAAAPPAPSTSSAAAALRLAETVFVAMMAFALGWSMRGSRAAERAAQPPGRRDDGIL